MAINKVIYGGTTLIDLSGDSLASASQLMQGVTAHDRTGALITGTATGGGGTGGNVWQDQDGYVHLDDEGSTPITVEPLSVTQNGTYTAPTGKAYTPVTVNVSGGGSEPAPRKQINFIDYDGTILHSYSKTEWSSVTALPSNPSHDGLTAQGWNWTKAQIDAQLTVMPDGDVWVGQMYITASGDTEMDVIFPDSARLSPIMTIAVNGTITVDWGDNTTPDTVTGTSLTSRKAVPHTYASTGSYTIVIHVVSGSFSFYCGSAYSLLRRNNNSNENGIYSSRIQNVRLGSGITNIADYAFTMCYSLKSVTIPQSITSIGAYAFNNCYAIKSVTVPSGHTTLNSSAFYFCLSIENIAIPYSVVSIGVSTLSYCYSLTGVTIPSGVTSVGASAFSTCYNLSSSLKLPSGLTSMANGVFNNCYCITNVTLPNSVTSIGNTTFSSCRSLASITIPSGVTSIGNSAFSSCYGVAEYHFKPTTVPTLGTTAFNNIPSDCKIYVPSASLADYQSATNWSAYASYMVGE